MIFFRFQNIIYLSVIISTDYNEIMDYNTLTVMGVAVALFYKWVATIFFVCMMWLPSMMVDRLIARLQNHVTTTESDLKQELLQWEQNFHLIKDYIEAINNLFGPILLLALGKLVFNINFSILFCLQYFNGKNNLYRFVDHCVRILVNFSYLMAIILASHRFQKKVSGVKHLLAVII